VPNIADKLISATRQLGHELDALKFPEPVAYVYNPLDYAWKAHAEYLRRYAAQPRRVLFLGMNPGPFGMAQTGIPFGEVTAVRDWVGIQTDIGKPAHEHPAKLVTGFNCPRSEVSGQRLWGLFAQRFGSAEKFFADHFVYNYCPLLFLDGGSGGKNLTPDKFAGPAVRQMLALCDAHLRLLVETLQIEWAIGVGGFAEERLREALGGSQPLTPSLSPSDGERVAEGRVRGFAEERFREALNGATPNIGRILHPSPASPAANRGWAGQATKELERLGVW
jgi:single-strand selective monofunctional uracil DNA glycosylase